MTIHFNTGRKYTAQGQRITATLHDDGVVTFMDHTRAIDGEFTLLDIDEFTQQTVMDYYDRNLNQSSKRSWQDGMLETGCNANWQG